MRLILSRFMLILAAVFMLASCRTSSNLGSEPELLIQDAKGTFQSMMKDNQYPGLVDLASRAKAIIIVPNMLKGAIFFGGRGGNAIMLARDESGHWSQPAFYTIGGISWGLQIGGQSSELVITVMTQKGLNAIMNREVTLGGDAGLAIGELGAGVNAATGVGLSSDMYAFARSEGLFVGVSLEGSDIHPRETWNQQMYGDHVSPEDILINRTEQSNSKAVSDIIAVMP